MQRQMRIAAVCGALAGLLSQPLIAWAGSIKVWSTTDTVKAADLNSNFSHIHNNMVGGHGARLVDADVATTAAIAHSKMATPALLPKAWAQLHAVCTADPCTVAASSKVTAVNKSATGAYNVTLAYTPANDNFAVIVSSEGSQHRCTATGQNHTGTPHFLVTCRDETPAAVNTAFDFIVMDDN